jgi:hypothetical protein
VSQPEHIFSQVALKLFSLYKMGSNEPEYTGVTREKKKGKTHTTNTRLRREKTKWPPLNLGTVGR